MVGRVDGICNVVFGTRCKGGPAARAEEKAKTQQSAPKPCHNKEDFMRPRGWQMRGKSQKRNMPCKDRRNHCQKPGFGLMREGFEAIMAA